MLKRAFLVSLICLTIFIFLFLTNLFIISKKDFANFHSIQQKSSALNSQTAYQERQNVKKDLYIVDNNTRNHYVIASDLSEIFINRKNLKYELIENLNKITFLCYEDVLGNQKFQHIKYITAEDGIYLFPSHKFELNDVNLSFVNTINKSKVSEVDFKNAYFKGKAKKLNFTVHKKKPTIEAISFDGSFNPKKGLRCEK